MSNGAKLESMDSSHHTPLHIACMHSHYDIAIMLIEGHANAHAKALNGRTPIDLIKSPTVKDRIIIIVKKMDQIHELEEASRLQRIQADIDHAKKLAAEEAARLAMEEEARQAALRRTAAFREQLLGIVSKSGEYNALIYLLERYHDEDINAPIDESRNALTLSAQHGHYDLIKILLSIPGIQINYQDSSKNTALHYAAMINHRDIIEELLLHHANNALLNKDGLVAANCCSNANLKEVLRNPKLVHNRAVYRDQVVQDIYKPKDTLSLPAIGSSFSASSSITGDDRPITPRKTQMLALPPIHTPSNAMVLTGKPKERLGSQYGDYPVNFTSCVVDFFAMKEIILDRLKAAKQDEISQELVYLQGNQLTCIANRHPLAPSVAASSSAPNNTNIQQSIYLLQYSYLPDAFDATSEWMDRKDLLYLIGYPHKDSVSGDGLDGRQFIHSLADLMDLLQMAFTSEYLPPEHAQYVSRYDMLFARMLQCMDQHTLGMSAEDTQRCCALASLCLCFLEHYLRFYDNTYISALQHTEPGEQLAAYLEQIQYLLDNGYIQRPAHRLLMKLAPLCHVKSFQTERKDEEDWDPLRDTWSVVLLNPPRALRLAVDHIFELSGLLLQHIEQLFPQDVIRGNIWHFKYKEAEAVRAQQMLTSKYANSAVALQPASLWLRDIQLIEYEEMFVKLGFKMLEDFQGLSEEDCYRFFPFLSVSSMCPCFCVDVSDLLQVGDRRRLVRHCTQLSMHMITLYKRRAADNGLLEADVHSVVTV